MISFKVKAEGYPEEAKKWSCWYIRLPHEPPWDKVEIYRIPITEEAEFINVFDSGYFCTAIFTEDEELIGEVRYDYFSGDKPMDGATYIYDFSIPELLSPWEQFLNMIGQGIVPFVGAMLTFGLVGIVIKGMFAKKG